jgi:hypothetical protein
MPTDDRTEAPIVDEAEELSEFDPSKMPLGTFAAFDVSDQPLFTTQESNQNHINDDQKAAIKAMVDAAARADSVPSTPPPRAASRAGTGCCWPSRAPA